MSVKYLKNVVKAMVYYYSLIFTLLGFSLLIAVTMLEVLKEPSSPYVLIILVFSLSYILL